MNFSIASVKETSKLRLVSKTTDLLHNLAIEAARAAEGSISVAESTLDRLVRERDSAELERELCMAYRGAALMGQIQRAFAELRISTHHDAAPEIHVPVETVRPVAPVAEIPPPSLLDTFIVNGQPIGDLTPEELLPAAQMRERDARFIRLLISGIPDNSRLRTHITPAEAAECYVKATEGEPEPEPPTPVAVRPRRRRRPERERRGPAANRSGRVSRRKVACHIRAGPFARSHGKAILLVESRTG